MTRGAPIALALALAACTAARADDDGGYDLRVASELTVDQGANAAISVAIVPASGRTVSADGPVRV
ncbi:MAG: hypothetical protein K8M05_09365, partial [Deltaproteobacteria bacterium]|nr:hypothetical protein [Kofleriaceae bacterium]